MVDRGGGTLRDSHRTNFHAPLWNSTMEWNDNIDDWKKFPCQPGFSLLFLFFYLFVGWAQLSVAWCVQWTLVMQAD